MSKRLTVIIPCKNRLMHFTFWTYDQYVHKMHHYASASEQLAAHKLSSHAMLPKTSGLRLGRCINIPPLFKTRKQ
jgi:hypothetical protein